MLEPQALETPGFERVSTTIVMRGGGHEGRGEDICYTPTDHDACRPAPARGRPRSPRSRAPRRRTCSRRPGLHAARDYRRWAFESAALDLALRQAGAARRGRRAAGAAALRRLDAARRARLAGRATGSSSRSTRFRASGTWRTWTPGRDRAHPRVRSQGALPRHPVDSVPDAAFHALIAGHFPEAVLEDVSLDADVLAALAGDLGRVSFDAPIHSLADVDALPCRSGTSTSSRRASARSRASSSASTPAWSAGSSCTAAASSSSASGAARSGDREPLLPGHAERRRPPAYNAPEPVAGLPQSPLAAGAERRDRVLSH